MQSLETSFIHQQNAFEVNRCWHRLYFMIWTATVCGPIRLWRNIRAVSCFGWSGKATPSTHAEVSVWPSRSTPTSWVTWYMGGGVMCLFVLQCWGFKPRASYMLGKCSTIQLPPRPYVFDFVTNCQIVFQHGWIILHVHQWHMWVPLPCLFVNTWCCPCF
jgi:hypothetical protein